MKSGADREAARGRGHPVGGRVGPEIEAASDEWEARAGLALEDQAVEEDGADASERAGRGPKRSGVRRVERVGTDSMKDAEIEEEARLEVDGAARRKADRT